jgi:transposase-like protein
MATEGNGAQGLGRLNQLRRQIERWRGTRVKRSPMPAELWRAATALARERGVSRVARELGVGYQSLRDRTGARSEPGAREAGAFVELAGASLLSAAPAAGRSEVELSDARGTTMVIRLAADQAVDVAALLAAFRRMPA